MSTAQEPDTGSNASVYVRAPNVILPSRITGKRGGEIGRVASTTQLNAFVAEALGSSEAVSSRLQDRVLLLGNPSKRTRSGESVLSKKKGRRRVRSGRKQKCRPLTSRERRRLGLYRLPRHIPYAEVQPLTHLWQQYAQSLIPIDRLDRLRPHERESVIDRILRMDLHGACIVVQQCPAPERVGIEGVVLQETEQTFRVVTRESRLRVLPKASTVFMARVSDTLSLVIRGDALLMRSAERSVRKPKRKPQMLL
ncbi:hypothetical protein CCYA_CCYA18G4543 [Cyanidiococcus yangmingshanensis]|nr:hypothetical protein CCYA_CCYA18G4543 [Cyanidiococcus yangmingshanensis]